MTGVLRGKFAMMDRRFTSVPMDVKARWWRLQYMGLVGYFAAFLGCSQVVLQQLGVISNYGARKILGVAQSFRISSELKRVKTDFKVCVQNDFCKAVVRYIGHCFRHPDHSVSELLSLPLQERLAERRLFQGRRESPSNFAQKGIGSFCPILVFIENL